MKEWVGGVLRSMGLHVQKWRDPYDDLVRLLDFEGSFAVIDCGAYKGNKAAQILSTFPQSHVYCFEPQPELFDGLVQRFQTEERCTPVQAALSDREGRLQFNITRDRFTSSLLQPTAADIEVDTSIEVDVTTIDRYVADSVPQTVRLLKLDLQGNELPALQGAQSTLDDCYAIVTEANFRKRYEGCSEFHELWGLLHDAGFDLYKIYEIHGYEDGGWKLGDALFVKRQLL